MKINVVAFCLCASTILFSACSSSNETLCVVDENYAPDISMLDFTTELNNLWWNTAQQSTQYILESDTERTTVELQGTEVIDGVSVRAVQERVTALDGGELRAETTRYYAEDASDNVWYFGSDTIKFLDENVYTTEGSWRAGVNGAQPGIVMFGDWDQPPAGVPYRIGYAPCVAENMAVIIEKGFPLTIGDHTYWGCIKTREFSALDPNANQIKIYCTHGALVREIDPITEETVKELVDVTWPYRK